MPDLVLVDHVLAGAWRRDSALHGESHWQAVAATGLDLVASKPGADHELVFLFGLLHDTRRQNEGRDYEHGPRAAGFTRDLHQTGVLKLDGGRLELLCDALERHAFGEISDDPTIGACWDADRLHLPRVGFEVNPSLLSTTAALADGALDAAAAHRSRPPAWAGLVVRIHDLSLTSR